MGSEKLSAPSLTSCVSSSDGRQDAFNMGSLRTELQIPSMFPSAQSIEERAESDDGAEEVEGEDEMLLGSTPSERFQVYTAVTSNPLSCQLRCHNISAADLSCE